jgi:TPR repeat protein
MKATSAIVVWSLAAFLATPALAQAGGGDYGERSAHDPGGFDDAVKPAKKKPGADPVGVAEDLRLKGECDKAVPILRGLADEGAGYEIAQFNLGLCLIDQAKVDGQHAPDLNKEGASWVLRAANAGYGQAQAEAVLLYLDATGVAADPVEARKWALIYHGNGLRLALGLPDIAPDVVSRLDAAMTAANRVEARSRAESWTATAANPDQ